MSRYSDPEFTTRISALLQEGKEELAIDEIIQAIQSADKLKDEEEACYLYSSLAGIYFVQEEMANALAALDECDAKYPNSVLAKFVYLENLFWHARNYGQAIHKADALIELVQMHLNYYNKALYLKGLAHAELGQFQQAIEMLRQTDYYDFALVEKLIAHGAGLMECQGFLLRALDKHKAFQVRGEDVETTTDKIEELINQIGLKLKDSQRKG